MLRAACLWLALAALTEAQTAAPPPSFSLRLHASHASVAPGSRTELAVEMTINRPWHMYHPIVLDTGIPTSIAFELPAGVTISPLEFPAPRFESKSEIEYLELSGTFVAIGTLTVDASVAVGSELAITARAKGLACIEQCVPVSATGTLRLAVTAETGAPAAEELFRAARSRLPSPLKDAKYLVGSTLTVSKSTLGIKEPAELVATLRVQAGHHVMDRTPGALGLVATRWFFEARDGVKIAAPAEQIWPEAKSTEFEGIGTISKHSGEAIIRIPIEIIDDKFASGPVTLRALLQYQACNESGQCFAPMMAATEVRFEAATPNAPAAPQAVAVDAPTTSLPQPPTAAAGGQAARRVPSGSLLVALVFALLGGLAMNVMPCVLPVISIKVLSFVQQAGDHPGRVLRLGLAFALGVLLWFWVLAAVAGLGSLQLRSQVQNPLANPTIAFAIGTLVFVMGLNLFGVFELELPGAAAGRLDAASRREGYPGAIAKGFLATLLGTACTAPFIGGALSFAVSQPLPVTFLVFTVAGVGMAAPYVVLAANPAWLRYVPRPGPWMVSFKQLMGFLLVGTAIWLLWVLRRSMGADGVVLVVGFWCFVALAAWIVGRIRPGASMARAATLWATAAAVGVGGFVLTLRWLYEPPAPREARTARTWSQADLVALVAPVGASNWETIPWVEYEPGLAEALSAAGHTVYVDYTADWCFNCKWNLKFVLQTGAVRQRMRELGVIPIEADYSAEDIDIRRDLDRHGALSVPLNLIFPAGRPDTPLRLPELLSTAGVLELLGAAGPSRGVSATAARVP